MSLREKRGGTKHAVPGIGWCGVMANTHTAMARSAMKEGVEEEALDKFWLLIF